MPYAQKIPIGPRHRGIYVMNEYVFLLLVKYINGCLRLNCYNIDPDITIILRVIRHVRPILRKHCWVIQVKSVPWVQHNRFFKRKFKLFQSVEFAFYYSLLYIKMIRKYVWQAHKPFDEKNYRIYQLFRCNSITFCQ